MIMCSPVEPNKQEEEFYERAERMTEADKITELQDALNRANALIGAQATENDKINRELFSQLTTANVEVKRLKALLNVDPQVPQSFFQAMVEATAMERDQLKQRVEELEKRIKDLTATNFIWQPKQ